MSKQYPGGLITKTPVTPSGPYETSTASGIWTLDQQAYWKKLGQWPSAGNPAPDAQFNYVTMLLHGDGTNGAQNNTFLDSSTNNFTITRNGNTTQGSFSPYGSNWSNYFDGSTSYLSVPSSSALAFGTGDFTVELWVNYYSDTGSYVLYDGRGTSISQIGFVIYLAGGTLYAQQGATPIVTTTSPTANTWHHIAFSRSGSSNKFFVDGTQVGTTVTDSTNYSTAYSVGIGTTLDSSYTSSYDLNGYLSNVRVVKGSAVYTSNFTPSTTPLTAITNTSLLTCQSNRFIDNSANNFTITTVGTPSVQRFNPFGASTAYSTSVIGGSGYFDGSGDYLTVANNSAFYLTTNSFTVEAWVYLTAAASSGANSFLFGNVQNNTGGGGYLFYIGADLKPVLYYTTSGSYNPSGAYTSSTAMPLNAWTHLAFVRSGDNWNIYINGVSTAAVTQSNSVYSSSNTFAIGADFLADSNTFLTGYISNLRFVNGTAVYTTNFTPPTAPLTAITNTVLLTSMTNGAIFDNAEMNDLETVGNAQISTSVVKYGTGSLAFDGSGDWLYQPSNLSAAFRTGDFTVEFWINPTNWTGTYIGVVATTTSNALWIGKNVSNFVLQLYGVADIVTYGTFPTTATWTHVAFSRSGTSVKMFYNGTQVASGTSSADFIAGNFYVGTDGGGGNLTGYIDDLRITKGYARYTTTFTPPTQAFPNFGPT